MATVAVYSVKGGVGKTTLAANLAWCSATISCRETLLWDLDAAGGAGFLLGMKPAAGTRAETLFSQDRNPAKLIRDTDYARLDVLPADESLRGLDRQLMRIGKKNHIAKLSKGLAKSYDRIVIDCPPVRSELSAQIMRAADLVIVPLPPSPLSTRAFDMVAAEVKSAGKAHPPILPVLAMVDMRRTLHREAREAAPNWPVIPFASAAEQCAVRQQPVGTFDQRSPAAQSFAGLWTAIERKLAAMK